MHEPTLTDREWLRDAIQAEEALDYDLQIGGKPPVKKPIDPIKLKEQLDRVRLHSLLYGELKRLLNEIDFGSGAAAAYTQGRRLIFERMQSLSLEQETALKQVLADSATVPPTQIQPQLRLQLYLLLNEADWQQITAMASAAVESKLLKQVVRV